MNVSLTEELEKFIHEQVESGRYRSASEAVRAGIRLLEKHTQEHQAKLEGLRKAVDQGLHELDQGQGLDGESGFDGIINGLEDADNIE